MKWNGLDICTFWYWLLFTTVYMWWYRVFGKYCPIRRLRTCFELRLPNKRTKRLGYCVRLGMYNTLAQYLLGELNSLSSLILDTYNRETCENLCKLRKRAMFSKHPVCSMIWWENYIDIFLLDDFYFCFINASLWPTSSLSSDRLCPPCHPPFLIL